MKVSFCPECDQRLKLGSHVYQGQHIHCPACEAQLVVTQVSPPELEPAALARSFSGSKKKIATQEASCPACNKKIHISGQSHIGQQVICRSCKTMLEITNMDPLEIEVAIPISWKSQWSETETRPAQPKRKSHKSDSTEY